MTTPLELVVLDMAGTSVLDDGVVEQAFQRAAERTGVADRMPWDEALDYVRVTMGQSKIDVFTHLSGGDAEAAARATGPPSRAPMPRSCPSRASPRSPAPPTRSRG